MIVILLAAVFTVLAGCIAIHAADPDVSEADSRVDAPTSQVCVAVTLLVIGYFVELATFGHAARTQVPFPRWFDDLPFVTIDDRAPYFGHAPYAARAALWTLVETASLVWLYLAMRGKRVQGIARIAIVCATAAMIAASLFLPATTSFDMYAYAGAAHVQNPYDPAAVAFDGSFAAINHIYGNPIYPTPYGPAWNILTRVVLGLAPTLQSQLFALRSLEIVALGACALALRRLRFEFAAIVLVVMNPALLANFVLDGHNDLIPIALVLWGIALSKDRPPVAMTLGILAGNVKLPFLFISALIFAREETPRKRIVSAGMVILGGLLFSAVFGGRDYLYALKATSQLYHTFGDPATTAIHIALGIAAVACVVAGVVARRFVSTGAWAFAGTAATLFGWYVPWGLPYAVSERRWLAPFLISMPTLSLLLATFYAPSPILGYGRTVLVIVGPLAAYLGLLKRFASRAAEGYSQSNMRR